MSITVQEKELEILFKNRREFADEKKAFLVSCRRRHSTELMKYLEVILELRDTNEESLKKYEKFIVDECMRRQNVCNFLFKSLDISNINVFTRNTEIVAFVHKLSQVPLATKCKFVSLRSAEGMYGYHRFVYHIPKGSSFSERENYSIQIQYSDLTGFSEHVADSVKASNKKNTIKEPGLTYPHFDKASIEFLKNFAFNVDEIKYFIKRVFKPDDLIYSEVVMTVFSNYIHNYAAAICFIVPDCYDDNGRSAQEMEVKTFGKYNHLRGFGMFVEHCKNNLPVDVLHQLFAYRYRLPFFDMNKLYTLIKNHPIFTVGCSFLFYVDGMPKRNEFYSERSIITYLLYVANSFNEAEIPNSWEDFMFYLRNHKLNYPTPNECMLHGGSINVPRKRIKKDCVVYVSNIKCDIIKHENHEGLACYQAVEGTFLTDINYDKGDTIFTRYKKKCMKQKS
jgi:hypothetical protein